MNKNSFNDNSLWSKSDYEIIEVEGIEFIAMKQGAEIVHYDPFTNVIQGIRPKGNDVEAHFNSTPHVALGQINPESYGDILKFVNKWGLLGLKEVHNTSFELSKILDMPNFISRFPDSKNLYKDSKRNLGERDREPIMVFQHAVREYQKILNKLLPYMNYSVPTEFRSKLEKRNFAEKFNSFEGNGKAPLKEELSKYNSLQLESTGAMEPFLQLNEKIKNSSSPQFYWSTSESGITLGWHFSSLLSAIYLRVALDFKEGKSFVKCKWKNCQKLFIPHNPNNQFCHERCRNSHNVRQHQLNSWLDKVVAEFNHLPANYITQLFNEIVEDGYSGEMKIRKEIQHRLEVSNMD